MKKFLILALLVLLVGCSPEEPIVEEVEVIPIDDEPYHNTKLVTSHNTIPHSIKYYEDMDDDVYGNFIVEMYDSKCELVWTYKWRDLIKQDEVFALKPFIYEDVIIVNVQGIISVHDLATGTFKWELETDSENRGFTVDDGVLYVLYYNNNTVTGIDLETGKVLLEIVDDKRDLIGLNVEDGLILAFKSGVEKDNAYFYDLEGDFIKSTDYSLPKQQITSWDLIETSDESEEGINLIDGSLQTVWTESVKGYGEKEWIEMTKNTPVKVSKLVIYNGNQSSEKAYEENAKMKSVVISIGTGKNFTYKFTEFNFGEPDVIEFVNPVVADYIYITIESAEPGTLYKNTGMTEVYTQ